MGTFGFYALLGFEHVLDFNGLDHFYFLIVLTLPFAFKHWKKVLWLVSVFTLGHTLSLTLAYKQWVVVDAAWIEFLIPLTIVISCFPLLLQTKKPSPSNDVVFMGVLTFVFGLIHGLGFARYFSQIVLEDEAYSALLSFALGVEGAQLLIVLGVLVVNFIVYNVLHFARQKGQLIVASMIAALAGQMLLLNWPL
jgi:hypothetical protein